MKKFLVFVGMFLCVVWVSATDIRTALKETAERFSSSLKPHTVVAIIGIYSESNELSEFMMDELTAQFIEIKTLTIADRANLEAIKKEMSFQLSGEVGDESIQQLGAKIGAATVIQGVLKQYGGTYTLTIRALNVTSAAISDMYRVDVELGEMELSMLGETSMPKRAKTKTSNAKKNRNINVGKISSTSAVKIGFQNLFFGLGSYRNGHPGHGAFLTVSHASGWIMLFSGVGVLLTAPSINPNDYAYAGGAPEDHPNYLNDMTVVGNWKVTGISLISLGVIVEVVAIVCGSVLPYYYDNTQNVIATADTSGFKLDLVATPKKNIAPQISYVFRY